MSKWGESAPEYKATGIWLFDRGSGKIGEEVKRTAYTISLRQPNGVVIVVLAQECEPVQAEAIQAYNAGLQDALDVVDNDLHPSIPAQFAKTFTQGWLDGLAGMKTQLKGDTHG